MEILDRKGELLAVRFDNGRVGVVDADGKVLMRFPKWERLAFAGHDFLKAAAEGGRFFVDMRSRKVYSEQPEVLAFGQIELLRVGQLLYTRTRLVYEVNSGGYSPVLAYNGSYLTLPRRRAVDGVPLVARRLTEWLHAVCVLAGDFSRYYWTVRLLKDGTVVVMDELGRYYHVTADATTGRAVKWLLGRAVTPSEEELVDMKVRALEEGILRRQQQELADRLATEERKRRERLEGLRRAEPFCMGTRWGLRLDGRIVVPPLYRRVLPPVGLHCAFEQFPGRWGVLALDGRVVVEARYQAVAFEDEHRALLTLASGRVECVAL